MAGSILGHLIECLIKLIKSSKYRIYGVILVVVLIGQILRILIIVTEPNIQILGDFLKITYIKNSGMAFSIMSGQRILLIMVPMILIIVLWMYWHKYQNEYKAIFSISVGLTMGGGISNLFERIRWYNVTDYIYVKGFSIFNLADICVVVGCVLLILSLIKYQKPRRDDNENLQLEK